MFKFKKINILLILISLFTLLNFDVSDAQDNRANQHKPIKQYTPRIVPNPLVPKAAYTVITSAFNVTLRDGVILDCSRFYPSVADPNFPNGYPVVIMAHGYGESKAVYATDANNQAKQGYVVYTYSMRGQGNSGGLSNLISTVEALDLIEFVNFIRHDVITRLDTSKILIEGGSQGGIIPFMAASMGGLNVNSIISDLASPEEGTTWIENGSIKMTYLWSISYTSDIVRYNSLIDAMRGWVYANNPEKYDSLAYWMPIGRDFKTQLSQITIPIFSENTWQDMFFNALGNIQGIPFINAPKRYYFGAVNGHGGETSSSENNLINQLWDEWYNYWLLNINNNLLSRPKYYFAYTQYPLTSSKWSFVHDSSTVWPPGDTADMKLYFNPGGKLLTTPPVDSQMTLVNNVTGGLTMQQAVDYAFKGNYFNSRFTKAELTFDSDPLPSDVKMIGNQLFNIDYISNVYECQFNFQIYDVSGSTIKLVTRANYTDWHNTPNIRKVKSFYGLSHSHIFKAGNKIRIVITNLDTSPNDNFLSTNPHVLPSLVNGNHTLSLNSNTFIDMHVRGVPLPVELSSFTSNVISRNVKLNWVTATETNNSGFEIYRKSAQTDWIKIGFVNGNGTTNTPVTYNYTDKDLNTGKYSYRLKQIDYNGNFKYYLMSGMAEIGTPNKFEVSQNYPNPFNPSTKIDYSIPQNSFVRLKVYDITGKEVAVLVNSHLPAGYYTVNFNADSYNLSSGIYFYKLSTADYSQVKEMLLIK